jgi:hypothetical protein
MLACGSVNMNGVKIFRWWPSDCQEFLRHVTNIHDSIELHAACFHYNEHIHTDIGITTYCLQGGEQEQFYGVS